MGIFKTGIKRTLWIPLHKTEKGEYRGILSDTSMDRDSELMSKKLITSWAENKSLPALVNHKNEMKSWVGGWSDFKTVSKGKNHALTAKYTFFSKEANPEAQRVKKQIDEAIDMGLNPGISIGAVPKKFIEVDRNGKSHKMWTKAELVEASFVPIQSNRHSYAYVQKSFLNKKCKKPKKRKGGKPVEEENMETKKSLKRKPAERVLSLKKEYLQKFYPTKKAVREAIEKAVDEKINEDVLKDMRIKCNNYVLKTLRKQIIVKKGFTEDMIINKEESGEAKPTVQNMERAKQGLKLIKTPKEEK